MNLLAIIAGVVLIGLGLVIHIGPWRFIAGVVGYAVAVPVAAALVAGAAAIIIATARLHGG